MTDYVSIIKKAIEAYCDENESIDKKEDLDTILDNVKKAWAPLKAVVVSIVAKIEHPEWDTRKHQAQIGGLRSLRTIDREHVSDYLFKNDFYDTATEFALTRSFEKAEEYTMNYTGKISPPICKNAFLTIVDFINNPGSKEKLQPMLAYLMKCLKERKDRNATLRTSRVESTRRLTLSDVLNGLNDIHSLGSGISVVPVIVVHTLLSVVQRYLFSGITFKDLKEHTAADNHSQSYGDVEGFKDTYPVISVEVKHNIPINETIVKIFDIKTIEARIPLKFILTTASTQKQFVENDICIDNVSDFTASYLHQVLLIEANICSMFIEELRKRIVSYRNISTEMKETIDGKLTKLLVPPSP